MKRFMLFIILVVVTCGLNAQNGIASTRDIQKFKSRVLFVILEGEKPGYTTYFNKSLKSVFKKYWTFNDSVIFIEKGKFNGLEDREVENIATINLSVVSCVGVDGKGWVESDF